MRALVSSKRLLFGLFTGTTAFLLFFAVPRLIQIKSIECESQYGPCPEEVIFDLSKFTGNYIEVKRGITNYLKDDASVDKYVLRFLLPGRFVVNLIQNKPQFGLQGEHGQVALVDSNGVVLNYEDDTLLPKIRINSQPPAVGDKVDSQTLFAMSILAYDKRLYSVQDGSLEDGNFMVAIAGAHFIYPLEGDVKKLIGSTIIITNEIERPGTTTVLNNANFESRMEERPDLSACKVSCTVDLRYKNPVVKI